MGCYQRVQEPAVATVHPEFVACVSYPRTLWPQVRKLSTNLRPEFSEFTPLLRNHRRVHGVPELRFDDYRMTSFSGLVLFQLLFKQLDLKARLRRAFGPGDRQRSFGLAVVVLQLVTQVLLGFRRLRDRDYFADDPMVCRTLGVSRLPDVATISRTLAAAPGA